MNVLFGMLEVQASRWLVPMASHTLVRGLLSPSLPLPPRPLPCPLRPLPPRPRPPPVPPVQHTKRMHSAQVRLLEKEGSDRRYLLCHRSLMPLLRMMSYAWTRSTELCPATRGLAVFAGRRLGRCLSTF